MKLVPGMTGGREMPRIQIAVVGPGSCSPEEAVAAARAGREIARAGAILLCGGLGGVMEAACMGAGAESGTTIGILPGPDGGNPSLSSVIPTGLGHARNAVLVQSADAGVAIGGSYRTLSRIALAIKAGREVFGYHRWDLPGMVPCRLDEEAVRSACAAAHRSLSYRSRQVPQGSR